MKINNYYQKFNYQIEKKITVEDFPKIKDYAKQGVYFYIIHDKIDNNRFLYLSSRHYEQNTIIQPESFKLLKIPGMMESVQLKVKISKFGIKFFRVSYSDKGDINIFFKDIIYSKTKDNKIFKKFKTHTKKIAVENPDWFLEFILDKKQKSHKKKVMKELLYNNEYNNEIIEHTLSTLFILYNNEYQRFNDHSVVIDGGKSGKSSLIGYLGEKTDNISVAGLYGSSDGKAGKFKSGLIGTTKKSILIDEINEMVKEKKGDKILSILNSLLENGEYNYRKQYGAKIESANQFFFIANLSDEFNFVNFINGTFGNAETIGRRLGIITYNDKLLGFRQGDIRPLNPSPFLNAISIYLSNLFNSILCNKKFIKKLYTHNLYKDYSNKYYKELTKIENKIEEPITKQFIKSHKTEINRLICRGLKLWIFENIDLFISGEKEFNNHSIHEILLRTEKVLNKNISNIKNIKDHIINYDIKENTEKENKETFEILNSNIKKILSFVWINKNVIDVKGIDYSNLEKRSIIKYEIKNIKNRGIPNKTNNILISYGILIKKLQDKIIFRIINKNIFNKRLNGIFEESKVKFTKKELDVNFEDDLT